MSALDRLRRGKQPRPPMMAVYGPHGVGKSTLAAEAPNPVFICTEDGLGSIDTTSFPLVRSYDEFVAALGELITEQHEFGTVVIDSLDWLEPLVWAEACKRHGKPDIEAFGYGKGYLAATDIWREVILGLTTLRDQKNMLVIMLAHADVKRFDSPETEPYDRYNIKLHKSAAALVVEACDIVGFANFKTIVTKTDAGFKKEVRRGITTGERLLYTVEKPAYIAKNRYALPESLPLSWAALNDAINASLTTAKE